MTASGFPAQTISSHAPPHRAASRDGWFQSVWNQRAGWGGAGRPLQPKRPLKPQSRGRKEQERAGWSICFSWCHHTCGLRSHRPWAAPAHLRAPKPDSDCEQSAVFEIEAQMPGGERDIPQSKWILPTPVPPYLPPSPKDISSETGITAPLCQNLSDTQAQMVSWVLGGGLPSLGKVFTHTRVCAHAHTHTLDN